MKLYRISCLLLGVWCSAAVATGSSQSEIKNITWQLGPNLPEFRKGACATTMKGKVISVFGMRQPWGEMATMYIYDPETNWWSRGPNGPIGQCYCNGTKCGNAYYATGGRSGHLGGVHGQCFRMEANGDSYSWTRIADLNERRGWSSPVSIGTKLYVFGGAGNTTGNTLSSVEELDTDQPDAKWRIISNIPGKSRGWMGAAVVKDKVYLVGGRHYSKTGKNEEQENEECKDLLEFDPEKNQWEQKAPLPYRLSGLDCVAYKDRYLIVVGGYGNENDFTPEMKQQLQKDKFYKSYYSPFVLVYDAEANEWHRMPDVMPVPTNDIRLVLIGNHLYALGGENKEPATSNTTPWLRIGEIQLSQ